jgi:hypothetical protein
MISRNAFTPRARKRVSLLERDDLELGVLHHGRLGATAAVLHDVLEIDGLGGGQGLDILFRSEGERAGIDIVADELEGAESMAELALGPQTIVLVGQGDLQCPRAGSIAVDDMGSGSVQTGVLPEFDGIHLGLELASEHGLRDPSEGEHQGHKSDLHDDEDDEDA